MTRPRTHVSLAAAPWTFRLASDRQAPQPVWTAFAGGALGAVVPGNVHDDLLRHGLIKNPYRDHNEDEQTWIGHEDWRYATTLPDIPAGFERVDLVAEGLDTVGVVTMAGQELGRGADQHRTWRFDVTSLARPGAELAVKFSSVYDYAAAMEKRLGGGPLPHSGVEEPFCYVRKMASNFGWDWGPTVVTAGIWKDIRLEAWSTARLAAVRPSAIMDGPSSTRGRVLVQVEIERSARGQNIPLMLEAEVSGVAKQSVVVLPGATVATLDLEASQVERWWPHGLGGQHMYRLDVTLTSFARGADTTDDDRLDSWQGDIGFRSIEVDTTPDDAGSAFTFVVNGRRIFSRGFNWIPNDLLISRVTKDDYRARLTDAIEAGANIVRVWGGGIFEKDEFYEVCDELGLMVWQDFLFACAAYPETDDFAAEVEAEERDNITRLMSHPSLALWNGCNEDIWGYWDWGWQEKLAGRPWGARYYFDLQPRLVAELNPDRPYWPGSPYSGSQELYPNDPGRGCTHSWTVWNETDYPDSRSFEPRFVSEFGWCGPADYATLCEAIGEDHMRAPDDRVLMAHFKAADGEKKLRRGLEPHFHIPEDFDPWHYLTQLNQARAMSHSIRYWRSLWPHCAGSIMWQLNDCWPVISWAAVDSAGRRKPVWHVVREAFADQLAVLRTRKDAPGEMEICLVNNGAGHWSADVHVRRVDATGRQLGGWEWSGSVQPDSVEAVAIEPVVAQPANPAGELLIADAAGQREVWSYVADKDFAYVQPDFDVVVEPAGEGEAVVRLTAHTLVRDLLLQADRLGPRATASAELVTLLPGETHEWHVAGLDRPLDPSDLSFPVITSVADVELAERSRTA